MVEKIKETKKTAREKIGRNVTYEQATHYLFSKMSLEKGYAENNPGKLAFESEERRVLKSLIPKKKEIRADYGGSIIGALRQRFGMHGGMVQELPSDYNGTTTGRIGYLLGKA